MNEPAQWRELLHKKDLEIEALHRQIDWLTQQLRRLNGRVYGCSSERSAELQEQLCLFEDASRKAALEGSSEASVLCRRKKRRGKREADFSGRTDPARTAAGAAPLSTVRRSAACLRTQRSAAGTDVYPCTVQAYRAYPSSENPVTETPYTGTPVMVEFRLSGFVSAAARFRLVWLSARQHRLHRIARSD